MELSLSSQEPESKKHGTSLLSLPSEIFLQIFVKLHYDSIISLRLTNQFLSELLPASVLPSYRDKEWLFGQETAVIQRSHEWRVARRERDEWLYSNRRSRLRGVSRLLRLFTSGKADEAANTTIEPESPGPKPVVRTLPCYTCFRWRTFDRFSFYMTGQPPRSRHRSLGSDGCTGRICIRCGLNTGLYGPLTVFYDKSLGHRGVCVECRELVPREAGTPRILLCATCVPDHYEAWHQTMVEYAQPRDGYVEMRRKYVDGMLRGKEKRMENGLQLRLERGKATADDLALHMSRMLSDSQGQTLQVNANNLDPLTAWPRYRIYGHDR